MANTAAKWNIDPAHSSANFSIKHMMISKVHGGFQKVSGRFEFDRENPANDYVEASIDVASISTNETKRDEHLKSADFFDALKYPAITFKSKRFDRAAGGLKITGDLTIHGVTKEVVLDAEAPSDEMKDPWGNTKIGISATTKIKRKDFGLTWNAALETGGIMVGDDVTITLDVQFAKA